jgi:hypothetical protein
MRRVAATLGTVLILTGVGCRSGQPFLVTAMGDKTTPGTIAGIVSAPGGEPLSGRNVYAVDVKSAQRYSAVTNVTGGFSIEVPPGEYRLQVDLRDGEHVVHEPGVVHINKSDLDANLKIVVGS